MRHQLLLILFIFILVNSSAIVNDISINGCKNVDPKLVESILDIHKDDEIYLSKSNNIAIQQKIKNLLKKCEYIKYVDCLVEKVDEVLVNIKVIISEHPLIKRYTFKGIDDIDKLKEKVSFPINRPATDKYLRKLKDIIEKEVDDKDIQLDKVIDEDGNLSIVIDVKKKRTNNKVERVFFEGNNELKTEQLKNQLTMSGIGNNGIIHNFRKLKFGLKPLKKWFFSSSNNELTDENVNEDRKKLIDYYHKNGFWDVKIDSDVQGKSKINDRYIDIKYHINEGAKYYLKSLEITGNKYYKNSVLREKIHINNDNVFDKVSFDNSIKEIEQSYASNGFIFVSVQPCIERVEMVNNRRYVYVKILIKEGDQKKIGNINVRGNKRTSENFFKKFISFKPGDTYDSSKFGLSYQYLSHSGLVDDKKFGMVQTLNKNDKNAIDITFIIKEKIKVSAQASISSKPAKDDNNIRPLCFCDYCNNCCDNYCNNYCKSVTPQGSLIFSINNLDFSKLLQFKNWKPLGKLHTLAISGSVSPVKDTSKEKNNIYLDCVADLNVGIPFLYKNFGASSSFTFKIDRDKWEDDDKEEEEGDDKNSCSIGTVRYLLGFDWNIKKFTFTLFRLKINYNWAIDDKSKRKLNIPFVHEIKYNAIRGHYFFPIGGYSWSINFEYNPLYKVSKDPNDSFYVQILSNYLFYFPIFGNLLKNRLTFKCRLWGAISVNNNFLSENKGKFSFYYNLIDGWNDIGIKSRVKMLIRGLNEYGLEEKRGDILLKSSFDIRCLLIESPFRLHGFCFLDVGYIFNKKISNDMAISYGIGLGALVPIIGEIGCYLNLKGDTNFCIYLNIGI